MCTHFTVHARDNIFHRIGVRLSPYAVQFPVLIMFQRPAAGARSTISGWHGFNSKDPLEKIVEICFPKCQIFQDIIYIRIYIYIFLLGGVGLFL